MIFLGRDNSLLGIGPATAAALAVLLAGCSSLGPGGGAPAPEDSPSLAILPAALPVFGHTVPGKPSELYTKLGRLAKACWFAPPAPLQVGYVFSADVAPESKGGVASIVIYQHNDGGLHGASAERGLLAFEITLSPSGGKTVIATGNHRVPEAFAERMTQDVDRWADGETGCAASAAWTASAGVPDAAPTVSGKKVKASVHP